MTSAPSLAQVLPSARPSYGNNIEALLNTNSSPSPEEEHEIRKLCQDVMKEVDNLKTEIAQTEAKLTSIRKQLSDGEQRIADYKDILNPVRRLPPDVLSEIFVLSEKHDLESLVATGSLHPKEMHWILPQVSGYWRSVALSSSQLWSTIRIADYELLHSSPLFMLSLQLHRAASHPLSISIHSKTSSVQLNHPILQTLLPLSPRWRALSLRMPQESLTNMLLAVHPFLSSLISMHVWPQDLQQDAIQISTALPTVPGTYPSLQHVSGHPTFFCSCFIPRDQITTYNCDIFCAMPTHLELLSLLPNLRNCCIHSIHLEMVANTPGHVTHPRLERLVICEKSSSFLLNSILNYLTLPSLKFLVLEQMSSTRRQPQPGYQPLVHFLNRSKCSLNVLVLNSKLNKLSEEAGLSILTALPSIKNLSLGCRLEAGSFNLINRIIETPTLVPLLQSLYICHSDIAVFPAASVSRWREGRPGLVIQVKWEP